MFKNIFLSILGVALILSGCSGSGILENANGTGELDALRNSRPSRRADINGTVKTIVGNEFTIETLDMGSGMDFQFDRETMQALTDSQRQEMMQKMQDARANAKKINVEVMIPVGIPIFVRTTATRGQGGFAGQTRPGNTAAGGLAATLGGGNNQNANRGGMGSGKQGTIDDIKKDYTVQIWLMTGSNDRNIAERVSVSQAVGGGFGAGFGAAQGGPGGMPGGGGQGGQRN